MIGRVMLRFCKGFGGTILAVMISALTFLKEDFVPEGNFEGLIWKTIIVGLIGGGLMALEKFKKMLNQHD